ncbi:hypothetical protein DFO46_4044 [Rhizobium sp. AG855]|nr:hypothetical protein DFO46_4044 [Rhizobium sp. AG855]
MNDLKIGFAGLGVMGEPMCRNILTKSGAPLQILDLNPAPVERLVALGAVPVESIAEMAKTADIIFLSLPGGLQVEQVISGAGGILENASPGLTVVDTSTLSVGLTRRLAAALAERDIAFADAPVARTRQAAEDGTLLTMVGSDLDVFNRIRPFLSYTSSEVLHCGPIGCGQLSKVLNNMILFENIVALSEALAVCKAAGMDPRRLFETLAKGSADSFALRNHGMKALVPQDFPENTFPINYAMKDMSCALELADELGIELQGAKLAWSLMERARESGNGARYFPILSQEISSSEPAS